MLKCIIQNKQHTIKRGRTHSNISQGEQNVYLQKPAVNRVDKIASNGEAPGSKIAANQQKQLNNILNKY